MTPRESFVQAIRDAPDDDTPRLVFADWLEENGEAARAEFVRVQCRLARPADDAVVESLREQEHQLLALHRQEWLAPLRVAEKQAVFRRGFVEEVDLGVTDFLHKAEGLFRVEPVTVLRVRPAQPEVASLRELVESPFVHLLRELDLNGHEHLPPMWKGSWRVVTNVGEDGLEGLLDSTPPRRLEVLRLARNEISNLGATLLAQSPWLAQLRTLDLAGNNLGPAGWERLARGSFSDRLTCLDLSGIQEYNMYTEDVFTRPNVGEAGVVSLARNPVGRPRRVNVAFNHVGARGVQALINSRPFQALDVLNVYEEFDGPRQVGPRESLTEEQRRRLRRHFGDRVTFRFPGQEPMV